MRPRIIMHGYIYQIFAAPAQESDWISQESVTDCLNLLPAADSVDLAKNREHAIRRFGGWLEQNQLGALLDTSFIVDTMAANRYFAGRFEGFRKLAKLLGAVTEEQYVHEHSYVQAMIDGLQHAFCDPFRDYMLLGDTVEPITLDEFIRTAEPDVRYYIGGVLDYHC